VNKRRLSFLIALFIHLLLLILFLFTSFKNIKKFITSRTKPKQETVVFFDREQPKKKLPPKPLPQKPKPAPKKKPPLPTPPLHKELAELRPATPTKKLPENAKPIPFRFEPKEQKTVEKAEIKAPEEKEEIKPYQKETERPKTLAEEKLLQYKKRKPIKLPELLPIKKISKEVQKKAALKHLLKPKAKKTAEAPEEAKKSFFQQTKLLIESTEDGNSIISRRGNSNLAPCLEEMKFISYEQSVVSHLVTEWKCLFTEGEKMSWPRTKRALRFTFEILEDGSVDGLELIESSGSPVFDRMVLKSIASAAPLPAIPKHLGVKRYRPRNLNIVVP
jgi:TonB family protein